MSERAVTGSPCIIITTEQLVQTAQEREGETELIWQANSFAFENLLTESRVSAERARGGRETV